MAIVPALEIGNLDASYRSAGMRRSPRQVLFDVSLTIDPGETVGLVGESGSGKTTLGRAVLGLVPGVSGTIRIDGKDATNPRRADRRRRAADVQVIFQDPYTSLNPTMSVDDILTEPLIAAGVKRTDARARVRDLLDRVALPSNSGSRFAREFSGGQRQRVAIARALALQPKLIVCDEPVSALDVSTQRRVLDLLIDLQNEFGIAYLFISHDLSVVRAISHRAAVMYRGRIIEHGPAAKITREPDQEYTKRLLLAAPLSDPDAQRERREALLRLKAMDASAEARPTVWSHR